jgi:hypothetical protein
MQIKYRHSVTGQLTNSLVRVSAMRESDDIGVRETLDIRGVYVDSRKPKLQMPVSNP